MGDLFGFLMSWPGLMTLIVLAYVVDDIFSMGWKEKVRGMLGQDEVPTNKELLRRIEALENFDNEDTLPS